MGVCVRVRVSARMRVLVRQCARTRESGVCVGTECELYMGACVRVRV